MILNHFLKNTKSLLSSPKYGIYIYLRDHNKLINPQSSKLNLSYRHPKKLFEGAPIHQQIEFKLQEELQKQLESQIYQQYKHKVLTGQVDQIIQKQADPLWGYQQIPTHYYSWMSKVQLMTVSHPQNKDIQSYFYSQFISFFQPEISYNPQISIPTNVHELVLYCLAARHHNQKNIQKWYKFQQGFGRGKKLHLLSSDQLIRLKWAFDGHQKYGTPIFHEILSSLLRQDISKMNKNQLLSLFYACRYSNRGATNLQKQIIQALNPHYKSLSFEQKVNFITALAVGSFSLKFHSKVHKRRRYQFRDLASEVLVRMNIWDLQLTPQLTSMLIFSLAKLRLQNTRYITEPLRDYVFQNLQQFGKQAKNLYIATVYLSQLQDGQGMLTQQLANKLRQVIVPRWNQFSKIQQIRIIHSFWNLGLLDQALLQLYKGIQFQADTTLLYYAAQIQLAVSSERQWQIIHLLVSIDHLPLPYYQTYQRFYNYIKATTDWDLKPLKDKLVNTQYHFNINRNYDSLLKVKTFKKIKQLQKFSGLHFFEERSPIKNIQSSHFGFPLHQVSVDIITQKQLIPGTDKFKQTYQNKIRSLRNIGWKHLSFKQSQLKEKNMQQILRLLQKSAEPQIEQQKKIIEYQDYLDSQNIQLQKIMLMIDDMEIDDINQLVKQIKNQQKAKTLQSTSNTIQQTQTNK